MDYRITAALIRAAHTAAQTAVATIGTATVLQEVDWRLVLSATALSAILSLLKSVTIGMPETDDFEDFDEDEEEEEDDDEEPVRFLNPEELETGTEPREDIELTEEEVLNFIEESEEEAAQEAENGAESDETEEDGEVNENGE